MRWGVALWLLLLEISSSWAVNEVCSPELIADRASLEFFLRPRTRTITIEASLGGPLRAVLPFYLGRPVVDVANKERLAYEDALDQGRVVQYRLEPLTQKVEGVVHTLDPERFLLESRYLKRAKAASRYRTLVGVDLLPLLGGAEPKRDIEVESTLHFEVGWNDLPGVYVGRLRPDNRDRDCPLPEFDVQLAIAPKVAVDLKQEKIELTPSSRVSPILSEVEVWLASNQSRWDLYLMSEALVQSSSKDLILPKKMFVREKGEGEWSALDAPYKVSSGHAGKKRKVATLEFFVESQQETPPGEYEGKIRWMVDSK